MYKYEVEEKIENLQREVQFERELIENIINSNNSLPIGRPMDIDGIEKYDEPDGDGYYVINKAAETIVKGKYMKTEPDVFKCTPEFMEKHNQKLKKYENELGSSTKKLDKINAKEKKHPRKLDDVQVFKYNGIKIDLNRDELENMLQNIQNNHDFIKTNTQLVYQSNSFIGKIKRFFGNNKILGFGDIQQVGEKIKLAQETEKSFIKDFLGRYTEQEIVRKCDELNCTTYDLALNMFKYDRIDGPEEIKIMEDYGPHDDFSREVGKFELEQFDYRCLPIAMKLHNARRTDNQTALDYQKAKRKEKNPMKIYKQDMPNNDISTTMETEKDKEDREDDFERS